MIRAIRIGAAVAFGLAAVVVAYFGGAAIAGGGILPGILCFVVALAMAGFPVYDVVTWLNTRQR